MVVDNIIDPNYWNDLNDFLIELQNSEYIRNTNKGFNVIENFIKLTDKIRSQVNELDDGVDEFNESNALENILYWVYQYLK